MKPKHVHFIINPASGSEEPILSYINTAFDESGIEWDISVTKRNVSTADVAQQLIGKTDMIAVYGGDGCVTEVAAALHGKNIPMAIIPGGTANVMAKELGIDTDSKVALKMLADGDYEIKQIDMGMVNDEPFLLRVNLGIMADMVLEADRNLKDNLGQLAYGVSAVKTIATAEQQKYKLLIDGEAVEESGVSLTVTNSGHIGIGNFALQPGISITDGLLDIVLIRNNDIGTLLKAAGSTLLQNETDAVAHWACKEVTIESTGELSFIRDDVEEKASTLKIGIVPASVSIAVPLTKN